jgi:hypothetical protein
LPCAGCSMFLRRTALDQGATARSRATAQLRAFCAPPTPPSSSTPAGKGNVYTTNPKNVAAFHSMTLWSGVAAVGLAIGARPGTRVVRSGGDP